MSTTSYSVCPWQAFPAKSNVRKTCQGQTLAYCKHSYITTVKSILTLGQRADIIKLLSIIYEFKLEKLAKDTSLLQTFKNYVCKNFYNIMHKGQCNKTFLAIIYKFSYKASLFVRLC